MPSRKGIWYLAPVLCFGIMHKAASCAVALPVVADSAIASVDISAKLSGYDTPYRENAGRIISTLEDQLHIKIRQPRIETSFFACRQVMMSTTWQQHLDFGREFGPRNFLDYYIRFTKDSLLLNGYISDKIFGIDGGTNAIYGVNTICLAPFDIPSEFFSRDWTLGHEIMHGYVEQTNPNFNSTDTPEKASIRKLVHEGIATYASDLVFGDGRFILNASMSIPSLYRQEDLEKDESLYYSLGTHFVSCAVDEVGLSALTLLAEHPPSTYDEIKDCKGYIHSLESVK